MTFMTSAYGQSLDWSYDYSVAESSMAIGVSESSIDQITVQGNTFPIGGAMGAFYLNEDNEYNKTNLDGNDETELDKDNSGINTSLVFTKCKKKSAYY